MTEWRAIPNWEGLYEVSDDARVRRVGKRELRQHDNGVGYLQVSLHNGKRYTRTGVHRLVGLAFIPNPGGLPEINHIDGNKKHNAPTNLEWVTGAQNRAHAFATGLSPQTDFARLTEEVVIYARKVFVPFDAEFGAAALARRFNVDFGVLHNAIRGDSWRHLPGARKLVDEPRPPRKSKKQYDAERYQRRKAMAQPEQTGET